MAFFLRGARTCFASLSSLGPLGTLATVASFAAVFFVAPDAGAFCRTTTAPLPPSYSPVAGCYEEGLPLYWKNACVGYSLQADASARVAYADAIRIIEAAFQTWTSSTCDGGQVGISASDLGSVTCDEVRYNSSGGNQNVIIFRDTSWPYPNDALNTLGLTTITFNADTGEIFDADLEINSSQRNLSIDDPVPSNGFDLLSVVTHEVGHFFGLAHASDSRSTMFASYKPGSSALRSLTPDDIAGLCSIYPTADTRNVATSVAASGVLAADACDPDPRHGFIRECSSAPSSGKGGCATTAGPAGSAAAPLLALCVGLGLFARRRRVRA